MKPLPRIEFVADKTEVEADKIRKLLKESFRLKNFLDYGSEIRDKNKL